MTVEVHDIVHVLYMIIYITNVHELCHMRRSVRCEIVCMNGDICDVVFSNE